MDDVTHGSFTRVSSTTLDIVRGKIEGSEEFGAYGKKITTGATTEGLLWANGDWFIPNQTVGEQIQIVSTSVEDGVNGIGLRSIHIHYLDSDLEPQSEEVFLNGITPTNTTATNIRFIQCGHIDTFGSSKNAVGTIKLTNIGGTKTYNQIDPLNKRCSSSLRMIPRGKRAIISGLVGSSISGTAAASSLISIGVSFFYNHDYTNDTILIPIATIGVQDTGLAYTLPIPHNIPEGTLVGMLCSTDGKATVTGNWFGWLENAV